MSEIPLTRSGLGSTFKRPVRSVTWPGGATSGQHRIVAGADTPPELASYGILEAVLFYITSAENIAGGAQIGDEIGYFFIGQSNVMDGFSNQDALLIGNVAYPTPGDPSSPTASDVKTNFQINLRGYSRDGSGALIPNVTFTIFKDGPIQINDSVSQLTYNGNVFLGTDTSARQIQLRNELMLLGAGFMTIANGTELNFQTGSQLLQNGVEDILDAETWTPTLTQSVTNPTAGFATLIGRYKRIGRTLWIFIRMTIDDITKAGNGNFIISGLPYAPNYLATPFHGIIRPNGGGAGGAIIAASGTNASTTLSDIIDVTGALVNDVSPRVMVNGDRLTLSSTYVKVN